MVSVSVGDAADEGGDNDLGALAADCEDSVVKDAVVAPFCEGFLLCFGEAEVDLGAPVLLDAVILIGLEEFVGADEAEGVVRVGGHGVLAAFAAGEGEQRGADAEAAGDISEQRAVFVVGVGDDDHEAGGGGEALEGLLEGGCSAVFGDWQGDAGGLGRRKFCDGLWWRGRRVLSGRRNGENRREEEAGKGRARCCPEMFDGRDHTYRQCTIR